MARTVASMKKRSRNQSQSDANKSKSLKHANYVFSSKKLTTNDAKRTNKYVKQSFNLLNNLVNGSEAYTQNFNLGPENDRRLLYAVNPSDGKVVSALLVNVGKPLPTTALIALGASSENHRRQGLSTRLGKEAVKLLQSNKNLAHITHIISEPINPYSQALLTKLDFSEINRIGKHIGHNRSVRADFTLSGLHVPKGTKLATYAHVLPVSELPRL